MAEELNKEIREINRLLKKDGKGIHRQLIYLNQNRLKVDLDERQIARSIKPLEKTLDQIKGTLDGTYRLMSNSLGQMISDMRSMTQKAQLISKTGGNSGSATGKNTAGSWKQWNIDLGTESALKTMLTNTSTSLNTLWSSGVENARKGADTRLADLIFGTTEGIESKEIKGTGGEAEEVLSFNWLKALGNLLTSAINYSKDELNQQESIFKSLVQNAYSTVMQQEEERRNSGINEAAEREEDLAVFNTYLGKEDAEEFQNQLIEIGRGSSMDYSMAATLGTTFLKNMGKDEALELIKGISDTATAQGWDNGQMSNAASILYAIKTGGIVSEEGLQTLKSIGLNLENVSSDSSAEDVFHAAITAMEGYEDRAEEMQSTTIGRMREVESLEEDQRVAYGKSYNEIAKRDLWLQAGYYRYYQDEIMNEQSILGAGDAKSAGEEKFQKRRAYWELRNDENYEEYLKDSFTLGEKTMEAEIQGMYNYMESTGFQKIIQLRQSIYNYAVRNMTQNILDTALGIADTFSQESYMMDEKYVSVDELKANPGRYIEWGNTGRYFDTLTGETLYKDTRKKATGMSRVPYDGYLASLHQGEVIIPASKAAEAARGKTVPNVNITVNADGISDPQALAKYIAMNFKKAVAKYA